MLKMTSLPIRKKRKLAQVEFVRIEHEALLVCLYDYYIQQKVDHTNIRKKIDQSSIITTQND